MPCWVAISLKQQTFATIHRPNMRPPKGYLLIFKPDLIDLSQLWIPCDETSVWPEFSHYYITTSRVQTVYAIEEQPTIPIFQEKLKLQFIQTHQIVDAGVIFNNF